MPGPMSPAPMTAIFLMLSSFNFDSPGGLRGLGSYGLPLRAPYLSNVFDSQSQAQAAADAKGSQAELLLPLHQLVHQGNGDAGSGAAGWMAERDRSAVDIQDLVVEVQVAIAGQNLRGEGLIQFDQLVIGGLDARLLFEKLAGRNGAEAHVAGIDARRGDGR